MTITTDELIRLVEARIAAGAYTLRAIARCAGTSPRSVQRHLQEAGLRFSALVDHGRRERALEMIDQYGVRLADIATQLGYREQSSFNRAFRRWTGLSPREFRARRRTAVWKCATPPDQVRPATGAQGQPAAPPPVPAHRHSR
jgi:AraC-like DNA-binding protein